MTVRQNQQVSVLFGANPVVDYASPKVHDDVATAQVTSANFRPTGTGFPGGKLGG
jgi:hypothetical protein